MTLEQAKKHWPKGTALGKLNLVLAEGRDPRLVLDSTICGVNPKCHLPEKVALPMAADICLATKPSDEHGAFTGASVDFKAAANKSRSSLTNTASCFLHLIKSYTTTVSATSGPAFQLIGGKEWEHSCSGKSTTCSATRHTKPGSM